MPLLQSLWFLSCKFSARRLAVQEGAPASALCQRDGRSSLISEAEPRPAGPEPNPWSRWTARPPGRPFSPAPGPVAGALLGAKLWREPVPSAQPWDLHPLCAQGTARERLPVEGGCLVGLPRENRRLKMLEVSWSRCSWIRKQEFPFCWELNPAPPAPRR